MKNFSEFVSDDSQFFDLWKIKKSNKAGKFTIQEVEIIGSKLSMEHEDSIIDYAKQNPDFIIHHNWNQVNQFIYSCVFNGEYQKFKK